MTDPSLPHDLDQVVAALAAADRVLVTTHENPDGDAIGSMSAAALALRSLGKEVRTYLHEDSSIPHEVSFLDTSGLERTNRAKPSIRNERPMVAMNSEIGGWPTSGRSTKRSIVRPTRTITPTMASNASPNGTWCSSRPTNVSAAKNTSDPCAKLNTPDAL